MSSTADKVTLVVNVASQCGLTPQYTQLEELQGRFGDRGFTVLGVPCNQFAGQEPGSPEQSAQFRSSTFGVTFPLSAKVDFNVDARHELYRELVTTADSEGHSGDIRWSFEKFLVGRDGKVLARFAPTTAPEDPAVLSAIEAALG